MLSDLISTHHLDLFVMTDTWLKPVYNITFSKLLQLGYSYLSTPQVSLQLCSFTNSAAARCLLKSATALNFNFL